jgi:quinol-cytochrome oxidoreductase complex cytochrome b subunit
MSLRIVKPRIQELPGGGGEAGDGWGTRIAKLIPAEALGLYGSAVALVTTNDEQARLIGLWTIVAVCCVLTFLIRYRGTLDPVTKRPGWKAIGIALISFLLWLTALGPPTSPIALPASYAFAGALAALLWGAVVPYFYVGE